VVAVAYGQAPSAPVGLGSQLAYVLVDFGLQRGGQRPAGALADDLVDQGAGRDTALGVHYAQHGRAFRTRAANAGLLGDLQGIIGKVRPPRSSRHRSTGSEHCSLPRTQVMSLSAPPASYTAAVERYLTGVGIAKASARIYRISLTRGWMLAGEPAPTGRARRVREAARLPRHRDRRPGTPRDAGRADGGAMADEMRPASVNRELSIARKGDRLVAAPRPDRRRPDDRDKAAGQRRRASRGSMRAARRAG
jgi:hypothetical protein